MHSKFCFFILFYLFIWILDEWPM